MAVRRLLASNRIVTRAVTHTPCQRPPNEVRQEALDFIHYLHEKLVGENRYLHEKLVGENRSTDYVINMDQTPVFFDMPSGKTLRPQGTLVFYHASSHFHFTNFCLFLSSGARTKQMWMCPLLSMIVPSRYIMSGTSS